MPANKLVKQRLNAIQEKIVSELNDDEFYSMVDEKYQEYVDDKLISHYQQIFKRR